MNKDEAKSDDVKKDGPPPPDIKTGPPAPPVPSALLKEEEKPATAPPVPGTGINVKIKEGDDKAGAATTKADDNRAGIGERLGGFLIDLMVCSGIMIVGSRIIPFELLDMIATLAAIAYLLTRDCLPFLNGRSLGKLAVGTRVETLDGKGISENWRAGVIRNVALIVPPFWIVELIMLLTREDKPEAGIRLGDEWSKTRVVKIAPVVAESETE